MQTFFVSSSFEATAKALDSKRLNKQILECYQILKVISTNGKAWAHHPATMMWRNHEKKLFAYTQAMIEEAKYRGIKTDKNEENINNLEKEYGNTWGDGSPEWLINPDKLLRVIHTHKYNLFNKDNEYYGSYLFAEQSIYNKPCCDKCKYFWPTHDRS